MFRDIIGDIKKFMAESLMLVSELSPVIGYDKASAVAYQALNRNTTLRDEETMASALHEILEAVYPPRLSYLPAACRDYPD